MYSELLHFIKYFKSSKWTGFSVSHFVSGFPLSSVKNTMRWNYKPIVTSSMPPQVFLGCASLAVHFMYVAYTLHLQLLFCNFRHNKDLWQQLHLWNTTIIIKGAKMFPLLRWVFGQLGLKKTKKNYFKLFATMVHIFISNLRGKKKLGMLQSNHEEWQ